jgi:hypothetical protein
MARPMHIFIFLLIVGLAFPFSVLSAKIDDDLDVCVVPHSHLDPGWKLTFDAYYEALVKKILERVLVHLWW